MWVERFWALCPIFLWPQPVPLMSQPVPFAPIHFLSCLSLPHLPQVTSPHVLACPQSVPLMSSLLPLPDPLLHCQPVLYPWAKVCILSGLMIRLSSFAERAILFTCSVERLCWRLRMTFIVLSCGFHLRVTFFAWETKVCLRFASLWSVTRSLLLNEGKSLVSPCAHCLPIQLHKVSSQVFDVTWMLLSKIA